MDAAITTHNDTPVVADGIKYWTAQPATYDGVLGRCMQLEKFALTSSIQMAGGFGTGVTISP